MKWINNGWITKALYRLQFNISDYYAENNMYYIGTEFHDLFRIGNYPDNILKSMIETLSFINEHDIELEDCGRELLIEFWAKYPDGLI